jgi:LAO/AO transport system kinase
MTVIMNKNTISEKLYERLLAGDTAALSYAISAIENNAYASAEIYTKAGAKSGRIAVIGFTGPPGVGKSTLINAYIDFLRKAGQRVAVVAVDPSSPISGGAILGDRFRMSAHIHDPGVFIRSVSSRGHLGGLCAAVFGIINLIDVAGWDVILLETVGAGQSDTDLADIADIKVVIQAPGLGDDMQAIKAGILEIADILVVNKADMPLADRTMRQLQAMVELRNEKNNQVPIIKTIATEGVGIEQLKRVIDSNSSNWKATDRQTRYRNRMQRFFAREVGQITERTLASMKHSELFLAYEKFILGELDMNQVVEQIIAGLWGNLNRKIDPENSVIDNRKLGSF